MTSQAARCARGQWARKSSATASAEPSAAASISARSLGGAARRRRALSARSSAASGIAPILAEHIARTAVGGREVPASARWLPEILAARFPRRRRRPATRPSPGLPAAQLARRRAATPLEQPFRRRPHRLGQPRAARLQRRPALLPHPSRVDRRLILNPQPKTAPPTPHHQLPLPPFAVATGVVRWNRPPGSDGAAAAAWAPFRPLRPAETPAQPRERHDHAAGDPRRDQARRRPLRLRPVEGPPRAARPPRRRGRGVMGTSHRQKPVKAVVGRVRAGLRELFSLPDGYEVALGNGGTTAFWDARPSGWSASARCTSPSASSPRSSRPSPRARPFLEDPIVVKAEPGDAPEPARDPSADVVAWAHNETSTGVMVPVQRPAGRRPRPHRRDLRRRRACRSTSRRPTPTTSPRRSPSPSDGGLWLALLSPAALERIEELAAPTAGSPSPCRWPPRWRTRARTRPTTRPRSRRSSCWPTRSSGCSATAGSTGACGARARPRATSTAGRRQRVRHAVRRRPRQALARRRHDRLRRRGRRRRGRRDAARQRHRRRRALPQARPQPAARRDVPGHRARRRRGAHRLHRLGRRADWPT